MVTSTAFEKKNGQTAAVNEQEGWQINATMLRYNDTDMHHPKALEN